MTREEILQAIEDLTAQIRTLSYSSSKEAAAQRADLQQRRRDLRAQLGTLEKLGGPEGGGGRDDVHKPFVQTGESLDL